MGVAGKNTIVSSRYVGICALDDSVIKIANIPTETIIPGTKATRLKRIVVEKVKIQREKQASRGTDIKVGR